MSQQPEHEDDFATYTQFREALDYCTHVYRNGAELWIDRHPEQLNGTPAETRALMEDLARGVVLKVYLAIVQADKRFSARERRLGQIILVALWHRHFALDEVGEVLKELMAFNDQYTWFTLVRPFEDVPALREQVADLEASILRLATFIATVDGRIGDSAARHLKGLQVELERHLRAVPIDGTTAAKSSLPRAEDIRKALDATPTVQRGNQSASLPPNGMSAVPAPTEKSQEERLSAAFKSLDEMIGLASIKNEVHELARFLRVQQERQRAGLPRTQISLHTIFAGNPGTGKTSVARVLGEVLGAMGIVEKGHLVEADRSALVAGYTGQTAEKTNKVIDRALGGVLFIDEAYSLIAEDGDDAFGHEAVQTLLRRMEDDRDRLVVILAGYSQPIRRLLNSNPGLSSRFQRTFQFPDYSVVELCQIFAGMCEKNHYVLSPATRSRLIAGLHYLHTHRDERFGNGRLARNVFEMAIRRLANRVADVAPLTRELLTHIEPGDIALAEVPESAFAALERGELRVRVKCPGCAQTSNLNPANLGRRVRCNKCGQQFDANWGEVA